MVWFVTGSKNNIALGVSESGVPICHGEGKHDPRPPGIDSYGGNIDPVLLKRIQGARCGWTVAATIDSELNIDGGGEGLFARVQESPLKSHGMIKFYDHESDAVTLVAVVPEATFAHVQRLFELVLTSDALVYSIAIEFLGVPVPNAQSLTPTWEEFVAGKPLFFSEVSFSVGAAKSDA